MKVAAALSCPPEPTSSFSNPPKGGQLREGKTSEEESKPRLCLKGQSAIASAPDPLDGRRE